MVGGFTKDDIDFFRCITECTEEVAESYLMNGDWLDFPTAVTSFLMRDRNIVSISTPPPVTISSSLRSQHLESFLPQEPNKNNNKKSKNKKQKQKEKKKKNNKKKSSSAGGRRNRGGDDDKDDVEETREYYTGGQKSVQDPSKNYDATSIDDVEDIPQPASVVSAAFSATPGNNAASAADTALLTTILDPDNNAAPAREATDCSTFLLNSDNNATSVVANTAHPPPVRFTEKDIEFFCHLTGSTEEVAESYLMNGDWPDLSTAIFRFLKRIMSIREETCYNTTESATSYLASHQWDCETALAAYQATAAPPPLVTISSSSTSQHLESFLPQEPNKNNNNNNKKQKEKKKKKNKKKSPISNTG
ncbi:hypothetical protein LINGRAHAP2_LOCUS18749 [Linum grandiflorum]